MMTTKEPTVLGMTIDILAIILMMVGVPMLWSMLWSMLWHEKGLFTLAFNLVVWCLVVIPFMILTTCISILTTCISICRPPLEKFLWAKANDLWKARKNNTNPTVSKLLYVLTEIVAFLLILISDDNSKDINSLMFLDAEEWETNKKDNLILEEIDYKNLPNLYHDDKGNIDLLTTRIAFEVFNGSDWVPAYWYDEGWDWLGIMSTGNDGTMKGGVWMITSIRNQGVINRGD